MMKFRHKPTVIEAVQYVDGMEDGLLVDVYDYHQQVFFKNHKKLKDSRFAHRVKKVHPAVMIGKRPEVVNPGDWIIKDVGVISEEELFRTYEPVEGKYDGKQDEKAEAAGGEHQEEDSEQPQGRPVQQKRSSLSDAVKK